MTLRLPALLLTTALLAALFILPGCGEATPAPQANETGNPSGTAAQVAEHAKRGGVRIGLLVHDPDGPWAQRRLAFAQQAADELNFTLVHLPIPDRDTALAAFDQLAEQGAGGVVVSTPDTTLGYDLVQRARAADVKVLSVDHSLVGANGLPHGVPHFGFDDAKIGKTTATVLDAVLRARGWRNDHADTTAICVLTDDRSESARTRTRAMVDTLAASRFPSDRLLEPTPPKPGDEPGADAAAVLLRQHDRIERWGVIGTNDQAVINALRVFADADAPTQSAVGVGINGVLALEEFRREPATAFHASVLLSARTHGYDAVSAMYHWVAQGAKPPAETLTDGRLIDRRNFEKIAREAGLE